MEYLLENYLYSLIIHSKLFWNSADNTGWSKSLCAPDNYSTIIRCTETFWSLCITWFNTWNEII